MARHGDGRIPLWLTELGWGSGKPNRFGLNKGVNGQARLLSRSFELILRAPRGLAGGPPVLVRLAGSGAGLSGGMQLLRHGRTAGVTTGHPSPPGAPTSGSRRAEASGEPGPSG